MICNIVERAGIEPATLTRVRPAFPLSYLPIYPLIAGIACPAHTTPRKGISTSLCHVFYRHIHGARCAGADGSGQTFIPRCWHAALLMSLRLPVSSGPQTLSLRRFGTGPRLAWAMIACLSTPSIPSPSVCSSALMPRRPHADLGTYGARIYHIFIFLFTIKVVI